VSAGDNREGELEDPSPWRTVWSRPASHHGGAQYAGLVGALRRFLTAFASARPPVDIATDLTDAVDQWTTILAGVSVGERDQFYGQRIDLDSRGQVATPLIAYTDLGRENLRATVLFDRLFLGSNGAAHGGAVAYVFDEAAGRLAHLEDRPTARTAYLRTTYRSIAPVGEALELMGRITREDGRKRFLHLEIRRKGEVCAEAEILMIALNPGQA
jgi:acyl-coenzyme A thioesterase PaaI-like protein